jgi:phage terminase large subunit
MVLPKCWFDTENTKLLLTALRHHHRKFNDKMRIFSAKPVKDFSSHACDAARYMAISLSELPKQKLAAQQTAQSEYSIHQEK